MTDVPANTGVEQDDEPWKVFNSCRDVLNHLRTVRPNIPLNEYLPNFAVEFLKYLQVIESTLQQPRDQNDISDIILGVNALIQSSNTKLLWTRWGLAKSIENDSKLYGFIGLCLILCVLSKDATVFQNVNATLPEASKILEKKI